MKLDFRINSILLLGVCLTAQLLVLHEARASGSPPLRNVIVMISDDLSPLYLDPNHQVKMPNLKNLAKRGSEFSNAHCALASCGPSRMAFMTGRFPTTTNLFSFERWVPQVPGLKTVAQYMAENHGYQTISFGKVFHDEKEVNDPETIGMFQANLWTDRQRGGGSSDGECKSRWFCSHKSLANAGDYTMTRRFIQFLASRNKTKPLLAFLGIRKPHMEVGVPVQFVNRKYPGQDYRTSSRPSALGKNNSIVAFGNSLHYVDCQAEVENRKVRSKKGYPPARFLFNRNRHLLREIRRYYFAAIAFVDYLVGLVVNWVDADPAYSDNTAFVFISDHGFANGEHSLFCKGSLFDQATRSAFVVAPAKNMNGVDRGRLSHDPVNLLDLFPTVVHLATDTILPREAEVDTSGLRLEGQTVLRPERQAISLYSFAQAPRCNLVHSRKSWPCGDVRKKCDRHRIRYMGFMVRTRTVKYIQWRPFVDTFTVCEKPNWPGLTSNIRAKMKTVFQIDSALTRTNFTEPIIQHELYSDFADDLNEKWGDWEASNALVTQMNNVSLIIEALELSGAVRWKLDPDFAGKKEPCNGNGYVRLVDPNKWHSLEQDVKRSDVRCECLAGFSGAECEIVSSTLRIR